MEDHKKRYLKERDKRLARAKKIPKEITRQRSKAYRDKNPEKVKEYRKEYYKKNKEVINEKSKEWAKKNPDKAKQCSLKYHYNLSIDEYNKLSIKQEHKCLICKEEKKLHVDHCHKTGEIRGLLCCKCNTGLGQFNDNEDYLLNAIEYLKKLRQINIGKE